MRFSADIAAGIQQGIATVQQDIGIVQSGVTAITNPGSAPAAPTTVNPYVASAATQVQQASAQAQAAGYGPTLLAAAAGGVLGGQRAAIALGALAWFFTKGPGAK